MHVGFSRADMRPGEMFLRRLIAGAVLLLSSFYSPLFCAETEDTWRIEYDSLTKTSILFLKGIGVYRIIDTERPPLTLGNFGFIAFDSVEDYDGHSLASYNQQSATSGTDNPKAPMSSKSIGIQGLARKLPFSSRLTTTTDAFVGRNEGSYHTEPSEASIHGLIIIYSLTSGIIFHVAFCRDFFHQSFLVVENAASFTPGILTDAGSEMIGSFELLFTINHINASNDYDTILLKFQAHCQNAPALLPSLTATENFTHYCNADSWLTVSCTHEFSFKNCDAVFAICSAPNLYHIVDSTEGIFTFDIGPAMTAFNEGGDTPGIPELVRNEYHTKNPHFVCTSVVSVGRSHIILFSNESTLELWRLPVPSVGIQGKGRPDLVTSFIEDVRDVRMLLLPCTSHSVHLLLVYGINGEDEHVGYFASVAPFRDTYMIHPLGFTKFDNFPSSAFYVSDIGYLFIQAGNKCYYHDVSQINYDVLTSDFKMTILCHFDLPYVAEAFLFNEYTKAIAFDFAPFNSERGLKLFVPSEVVYLTILNVIIEPWFRSLVTSMTFQEYQTLVKLKANFISVSHGYDEVFPEVLITERLMNLSVDHIIRIYEPSMSFPESCIYHYVRLTLQMDPAVEPCKRGGTSLPGKKSLFDKVPATKRAPSTQRTSVGRPLMTRLASSGGAFASPYFSSTNQPNYSVPEQLHAPNNDFLNPYGKTLSPNVAPQVNPWNDLVDFGIFDPDSLKFFT